MKTRKLQQESASKQILNGAPKKLFVVSVTLRSERNASKSVDFCFFGIVGSFKKNLKASLRSANAATCGEPSLYKIGQTLSRHGMSAPIGPYRFQIFLNTAQVVGL
jgi:hypothetical protein